MVIGLLLPDYSEIAHDLHLSKSQINYNQTNQSIEITLHLFIDDLEIALSEEGYTDLLICTKKESEHAEDYMAAYINDKMTINIDDRLYRASFLGKESSDDLQGVWCYLEINEVPQPEKMKVAIDFFNELYTDQKNVLNIKLDEDSQEYYLLNKKKTTAELSRDD
jgi:hypothetical protein